MRQTHGRQREARPGRADQTRRGNPGGLGQDIVAPLEFNGRQLAIRLPPVPRLDPGTAALSDVIAAVNLLIDNNNKMRGA